MGNSNLKVRKSYRGAEPLFIFHTLEDQVEGHSIHGINTCSVSFALRKHVLKEFCFFGRWLPALISASALGFRNSSMRS
jgi:hypothetical protein